MAATLTALAYSGGALAEIQTLSARPAGYDGKIDCAHLALSHDGRYAYVSHRFHNSVSVLSIDPASGRLTLLQQIPTRGDSPRHFAFDPSGKILLVANQQGNSVITFHVDPGTGTLTRTGHSIEVIQPAFIGCV